VSDSRSSRRDGVVCSSLCGLVWLTLLLTSAPDLSAQDRVGDLVITARDAARQPVSGVEISIDGGDWHTATTDASGLARIRVTPGYWDVVGLHTEQAVVPTRVTVGVRAGESRTIELTAMPRAATIQGRLALQSPLPVILERLHAAAYPADLAGGTLPVAVAPVSEDGGFTLRVPPGRWRVCLLEIPQVVAERELTVTSGQEATAHLQVDFRALTGVAGFAFEAGLITERIGPVFSLTTVGLYTIDARRGPSILTTTQVRADQTYAVLAPAPPESDVYAFAWRPGWTAVPSALRNRARSGEVAFADFRFVPNSGTVTGTVVDPMGRPVSEAWIGVASAVRYEEWMMGNKPIRTVDGTFHVRVPLGPILIRAWRDSDRPGEPQRVQVPGAAPVAIRLATP
jgi:hypothetical protein